MYGGIEAGGTKFVCAVSDGGEILEKLSIPTTTPEETLDQVFEFFDRYELKGIRDWLIRPDWYRQNKR